MPRSSCYYPRDRGQKQQREQQLLHQIEEILVTHAAYGYRRITHHLKRDGILVNHKVVLRLMRQSGLTRKARKRFIATTDSQHALRVFPNLYQNRPATALNQIWLSDITYIHLRDHPIYLACVLDAFSRRVIGWALSQSLSSTLSVSALKSALAHRTPAPGCLHHSDRGVQYACHEYIELLIAHGIEISMSRTGNPYDNGMMERFFRTLKSEEVYLSDYADEQEAAASIRTFIDHVYNQKRLHSALGYLPPAEFETQQNQPTLIQYP